MKIILSLMLCQTTKASTQHILDVSSTQVTNASQGWVEWLKSTVEFTQSAYCLDGLQDWSCTSCVNGDDTWGTSNVTMVGEYYTRAFG